MEYAGVDVSNDKLDVSLGGKRPARTFPNTATGIRALVSWLLTSRPRDELHVVLEPTSTYHHLLVQTLVQEGLAYTAINPARTAAFARVQGKRAKTDGVDACLLAAFGESQHPDPSRPPDEAQERLKALRRHLDWLQEEIQAARNRLHAAERSPWTPRSVLDSLKRTIHELEQEAERVRGELQSHIEHDERWQAEVRLLTSIPSIGWGSAVLLLSEMPAVTNCASAKTWAAFAGVCPALHESGQGRSSRLSRAGAERVRRGLYMPAVSAIRWNPGVQDLTQRMRAKGKSGKSCVAAGMHKLLRQCFGVLKSGTPYDPSLYRPAIS